MIRSDADLLKAYVLQGSQDAFREIVNRHGGLVFSICRRKLGDSHLAEDASQTVFATFVAKAAQLEAGPLDGLLAKLALRTCKDICRSRSTRKAHELRLQEAFRLMHLPDEPDSRLAALNKVLEQMRETYRDVVMLRYIEQMDVEAVGQALGLSVDAVKKRLVRALAYLRERMEAQGFMLSLSVTAGLLRGLHFPPPPGLAEGILSSNCGSRSPIAHPSRRAPLFVQTARELIPLSVAAAIAVAALMPRTRPGISAAAMVPGFTTDRPAPSTAHRATAPVVEQQLRRKVPDLTARGGLQITLLAYSRWSGVPIDPQWDELKAVGIGPNTPVNRQITDLTLAQALDEVLLAVSPSGKLSFEVSEGRILIRADVARWP